MGKEVSLAVSHRIFKWKKVSDGKFGEKKKDILLQCTLS